MKKSLPFILALGFCSLGFSAENTDVAANTPRPRVHHDYNQKPQENTQQNDCCGMSMFGDFLYWKTVRDGNDFYTGNLAFVENFAALVDNNLVPKGRTDSVNPGLKPGFRFGVSIGKLKKDWELQSTYTLFHAKNSSSPTGSEDGNSIKDTIYSQNQIVGPPGALSINPYASYSLNYNVVDLLLRKTFTTDSFISFTPCLGLLGTWQKEQLKVNTNQMENPDFVGFEATTVYQMLTKQHFWGLGPKAGIDTQWHFVKDFSFVGALNVSLLWGAFNNERIDTYLETTPTSFGTVAMQHENVQVVHMNGRFHQLVPMINTDLGFMWNHKFENSCAEVFIKALWEMSVYFDYNHFIALPGSSQPSGNLNLQGLTLRCGANF